MIFEFVIAADEELKILEHVATKGYRIRPTNVICLTGYDRNPAGPSPSKKTRWRKKQCLPNLRCQLLVQDKRLHNHCIFEYIMIRPTSASKKIYSRQTLGLPFHCLNLALVVGGKKKKQGRIHNKPLLTQVFSLVNYDHVHLQGKRTKCCISFPGITCCNLNNRGVNFLSNDCPYIYHPLELFLFGNFL